VSAATRQLREALAQWDVHVRQAERAGNVTARMRTLGELLVAGGNLADAARDALGPLVTEGNGQAAER
jgi:hypothetical protein